MQISAINNNYQNVNNPQFKSAYPVRYWVAEATGGKYAPALTRDLSKFLNTKIVEMLNKPLCQIVSKIERLEAEKIGLKRIPVKLERDIEKLSIIKRVKNFIANRDAAYVREPFVRSFNAEKDQINSQNEPISYLITGADAHYFIETFGKPIGVVKAELENKYGAAEIEQKLADYWTKGYTYVKNVSKNYCKNGEPLELHVKLDTVRTKTGTIKDYKVVDMTFLPRNVLDDLAQAAEWANK